MLSARVTDDENSELDYSDWEKSSQLLGAYVNWVPTEKWTWFAGYNHSRHATESHVCIPVFDG